MLAISSQPPGADQTALEIPEIECRRGGLSELKRAWITISEYNYDIAERSHYLDPNQDLLGTVKVAMAVTPLFREPGKRVDRNE